MHTRLVFSFHKLVTVGAISIFTEIYEYNILLLKYAIKKLLCNFLRNNELALLSLFVFFLPFFFFSFPFFLFFFLFSKTQVRNSRHALCREAFTTSFCMWIIWGDTWFHVYNSLMRNTKLLMGRKVLQFFQRRKLRTNYKYLRNICACRTSSVT